MNHIEAMKTALEALKKLYGILTVEEIEPVDKAITALRTAIEQAEKQEPVFWYRPVGEDGGYEGPLHNGVIEKVRKESGSWKPLYTTPSAAQPCPTCEALARTVMMDQTGRDA